MIALVKFWSNAKGKILLQWKQSGSESILGGGTKFEEIKEGGLTIHSMPSMRRVEKTRSSLLQ